MLQRAKTQTVELAIYRDGGIITPASATYQLLDEDGSEIIGISRVCLVSFELRSKTSPSSTAVSTRDPV